MNMRGIILAGGSGSRLWPITLSVNKHLLPVFDKPMIHYPMATLLAAGIREIAIICRPEDLHLYRQLLGDGINLGITITYFEQNEPKGIAEAFLITEDFIRDHKVALILGDNIFHGTGMGRQLMDYSNVDGAHVFAYKVADPSNYGVIEFDLNGNVMSITEKPADPKSNYAIPGLYFFDEDVVRHARSVTPSSRGELEIIDVLQSYRSENKLFTSILPRGTAWLDTGTAEALQEAGSYVRIIEQRQGRKIACIEEIAWRQKWIDEAGLQLLIDGFGHSSYGQYLRAILLENRELES
jgi:glucose-1-phosphate thymidylyltransferase